MSYQVIARKWRPQTFEEVIGQEAITRTLRNAIEHERLHHAYLFSGARGVGKTTTARLLAKALNCRKTDKPNPIPCAPNDADACVSCKEIAENRSIDVFEFDAASHTGVDDIREIILESINIGAARDRYKIFVIDEVHMLSKSSFNALLKTLEEPPPFVVFIMATTELNKIPDTILSRCQEFQFRTITLQKIFDRLKLIADTEKIDIADGALREIARAGEGSMRDAQSAFDQVISFSGESIEISDVITALGVASAEMLTKVVMAIAENKPSQALKTVDELIVRGQDLRSFCRDLLALFRDLLMMKMVGDAENLLDSAVLDLDELKKLAEPFSESDFIRFFNSLSDTETKLREANEPRYVLEVGLVKLIEMRRVAPLEKILERLANLENALANGNLQVENLPQVSQTPKPEIPTAEKKNLKVDFPAEDVPFDVGSRFETTKVEAEVSELQVETQSSVETKTQEKAEIESPPKIEETSFNNDEPPFDFDEPPFEMNEPPPDFSPFEENGNGNLPEVAKVSTDNFRIEDFMTELPSNLAELSSEELEHIDDNWLDAAYERKLLRAGEDLYVVKNASALAVKMIGVKQQTTSISNGNGTAAQPAKEKPVLNITMPEFETESDEIPEFPENPTEEQLWEYAEKHPITKRIKRIFRGTLIKVEKL